MTRVDARLRFSRAPFCVNFFLCSFFLRTPGFACSAVDDVEDVFPMGFNRAQPALSATTLINDERQDGEAGLAFDRNSIKF